MLATGIQGLVIIIIVVVIIIIILIIIVTVIIVILMTQVPTSTNALVELMNMVERWRQRTDYGPVVVVSQDGISR